jgi:ribA/ribD-fused uncharacterized protein
MNRKINFYKVNEPYGCFSNFSPYPIKLKNRVWPTSEHYFQAQKFSGTDFEEAIRKEPSPMKAALMGRDRKKPLRNDWEIIKDEVMYEAVRAKVLQHETVRTELKSTLNAEIVEHTKNDNYWGDGGDGTGKNMLGKI